MSTKEIKELKDRVLRLEKLCINLQAFKHTLEECGSSTIDKSEERIKSLEERVLQQSNSNTQILIKTVKLDEYNEELLERIKSLEGGCKCKANNNYELDQLREANKNLKQTLKDLKPQTIIHLYNQYESGQITREQYYKYVECLKYF